MPSFSFKPPRGKYRELDFDGEAGRLAGAGASEPDWRRASATGVGGAETAGAAAAASVLAVSIFAAVLVVEVLNTNAGGCSMELRLGEGGAAAEAAS